MKNLEEANAELCLESASVDHIENIESTDLNPQKVNIFNRCAITGSNFLEQQIPPRKYILEPFFCEADYGIIYAARGVGKSWFCLMLSKLITSHEETGLQGGNYLTRSDETFSTLYIDAEMNKVDLQSRCKLLALNNTEINIISHEDFYAHSGEKSLNLTNTQLQDDLLEHCIEQNIKVCIIDNLSTAFNGLKENENDSWEKVSCWLLKLRRNGIAVILVCHSGKNGEIRGASRREDSAHWVIKLTKSSSENEGEHTFKTTFTKNRNSIPSENSTLEWTISGEGKISLGKEYDWGEEMLKLINEGVDRNSVLAKQLDKSKSAISKKAKTLEEKGLIEIKGGVYNKV